jgi:hypothetical protein
MDGERLPGSADLHLRLLPSGHTLNTTLLLDPPLSQLDGQATASILPSYSPFG